MTNQDESMIQIQSHNFWWDRNKFNTNTMNNRVREVRQSLICPESKPTKNWYLKQRENN